MNNIINKRVLFVGLFNLFYLFSFCQAFRINDTIFTVDKLIPSYLDISREKIQKKRINIKDNNEQLNLFLNLNSESSAVLKDTLTDIAGGFHESYIEFYKGVEVEDTRCTIHYGNDGIAKNINGNFRTIEKMSVVPKIDEKKALEYAHSYVETIKYIREYDSSSKGSIMIFFKG